MPANEDNRVAAFGVNAAYQVTALVDPGRGGRRIAILSSLRQRPAAGAAAAMPATVAGFDLIYTSGRPSEKAVTRRRKARRQLGHIIPDVMAPGDVVRVRGAAASGGSRSMIIEALRSIPRTMRANHGL